GRLALTSHRRRRAHDPGHAAREHRRGGRAPGRDRMTVRPVRRHRSAVALGLLGAAVLTAPGCSDDGEGSDDTVDPSDLVTVVDAAPLEASLAEGEQLGIRFPSSSSIGDDWVLLGSTDESIATIVDEL